MIFKTVLIDVNRTAGPSVIVVAMIELQDSDA